MKRIGLALAVAMLLSAGLPSGVQAATSIIVGNMTNSQTIRVSSHQGDAIVEHGEAAWSILDARLHASDGRVFSVVDPHKGCSDADGNGWKIMIRGWNAEKGMKSLGKPIDICEHLQPMEIGCVWVGIYNNKVKATQRPESACAQQWWDDHGRAGFKTMVKVLADVAGALLSAAAEE